MQRKGESKDVPFAFVDLHVSLVARKIMDGCVGFDVGRCMQREKHVAAGPRVPVSQCGVARETKPQAASTAK